MATGDKTIIASTSYVDTGLETKQDVLVSGTNIKTVNGNNLLGSGDIELDTFTYTTGDIAYSSDPNKYTAPTWIEANGNSYDAEVYDELKTNLGATVLYDAGRVADHIPIIDCDMATNFEGLGSNTISKIFYSKNKEYVIINPGSDAKKMLIFQLDVVDNVYKLKSEFTTAGGYIYAAISNSGKYIAYTAGNNGYLTMWNGTAYSSQTSISIAAYAHMLATISDTDLYVAFTCNSSGFFKLYYITPDTTTMTVCTGSIPVVTNGSWCTWLPNSNTFVIQGTSTVEMLTISGIVITNIQTISSTMVRDIGYINADRTYLLVHKNVSPQFEIFKVSATGFTSIYTESYSTAQFSALWHENRLLILGSKAVGTFDAVYTIDTSNDSVTKVTNMFGVAGNYVYSNGSTLKNTSSATYFNNRSNLLYFNDVSYIYDEVSNQYKFYDFGWGSINNIPSISSKLFYSINKDYMLIRYLGTTFIVNVEDELYPVRSTLQYVRKRTTWTNYSDAYFTFHPYIFISMDNSVTNSKFFCIIDPQTGLISEHPATTPAYNLNPSNVIVYSMSEEGNCAMSVYYDGSSYRASAVYLNNGVWESTTNGSALSSTVTVDLPYIIKHNNLSLYLTTNMGTIEKVYVYTNNRYIYTQSNGGSDLGADSSAGRVIISKDGSTVVYAANHGSTNQSWYAKRNGVVYTLGVYGSSAYANLIYVSDDGKVITYGTKPTTTYFWSESRATYITISTNEGFTYDISNYGLLGQLKPGFFKADSEYGVSENFRIIQKKYKVPNIPLIRNSVENQVKVYINTGVTQ